MTNQLQEQVKAQKNTAEKTLIQIIIDNIEIYVTMVVQYYFLIINLTYFVVQTALVQNENPIYCIPFFFLMYSIGDFLGKFIPAQWVSNNTLVMYLISLYFPLLTAYFNAYAFFTDKGSFIQGVQLKAVILVFTGIINGYNTNNIFCNAITRQEGPN